MNQPRLTTEDDQVITIPTNAGQLLMEGDNSQVNFFFTLDIMSILMLICSLVGNVEKYAEYICIRFNNVNRYLVAWNCEVYASYRTELPLCEVLILLLI